MTHHTCIIEFSLNTDKIDDLQAHTCEDYFSQTLMLLITSENVTVKLLLLLSNYLSILKVHQIIIRLAKSQKLDLV